jgi:hypothetical protein
MPGLIAVPCRQDQARYVDFYRCLNAMEKPEGTKLEYFPGFFPDYNINNGVDYLLKNNLDWMFIADDDMILTPHTLTRALASEKDIVGVNLLYRNDPFNPYIYHATKENGEAFPDVLVDGEVGLRTVAACGTGGLLIRRNVFERFAANERKPFNHDDILKTYDLYFCHWARKYGFEIFVDTGNVTGHIIQAVVWPNHIEGKWKTTVVMNGTARLNLPAASRYPDGTIKI